MKESHRSSWPTVSMIAGGIPVSLGCQDAGLLEQLAQRYPGFQTHRKARFRIWVSVSPSPDQNVGFEAKPVFREGLLCFEAPGYAGFLDERKGVGELSIASTRPVEGIDYFLRLTYALLAFREGGFLFHAAGIVRAGRAYLFFGHSGSGKTTVARLSKDNIVLNDDLVLLLPRKDGWVVHATPFSNPDQVQPSPASAPLGGLFRLAKSKKVYLEPIGAGQALAELVSSVPVIPDDPVRSPGLLQRGARLLQAIPAFRLHFLPDPSFWDVID